MTSATNVINPSLIKIEELNISRTSCETQGNTILQSVDTQSMSSLNEYNEIKDVKKIKGTKKKRRASDDHAFQRMRNYQVFQQAIFIALLSQFFEIVIRPPVKKSIVSFQLLRVDAIKLMKDVLSINDFIIARCKEKYKMDIKMGTLEKTAKRRSDTNRVTELLHLLQDLLREKGFIFISKFTDGKNGAQVIETITSIKGPNGLYLTQTDITKKGETISKYLNSEMSKSTRKFIPMNDKTLQSILFD
ncbi:hypothetical protein ENUP19_0003G0050 [Entamoeba nuttalli]|uniref:Uncharacterized protein n=2 Tax=Entamoeba nuttalli TaxID=412467 RepID=K2H4T1_ENTNP|nr:hypothetical protein ENU1_058420 [Entamoeba nuttalli P19]EKE41367.1 hypothetical protein ENU1_058420 [Entamoeba nuttalli P19]|eukprot:XP_008856303.1 hypothetical protein ENU1_058420 [Entamoeba nuttalli P19]